MNLLWIGGGLAATVIVVVLFVLGGNAAARESGLLPPRGHATMADVERLARAGHKIAAIRCYREIHNVGLAEAKKAVEDLSLKS
ncbi:MAG: hypothetical protein ABSE48_09045 [Verrucomicrobiota bacterium]|jgi:ribosomal protein L7/L12